MSESLSQPRATIRIGQGFDVHPIQEGRPLFLGGVQIPSPFGLQGHSDADVLIHAIGDALLGAAGLGDLGAHFPDTDARFKGIRSTLLLSQIAEALSQQGASVINVDAMLLAEAPKIAPYRDAMRAAIAEALKVAPTLVSVKATTCERLGFVGRREGMAALAVALIEFRES